jgi:hypothetical protein
MDSRESHPAFPTCQSVLPCPALVKRGWGIFQEMPGIKCQLSFAITVVRRDSDNPFIKKSIKKKIGEYWGGKRRTPRRRERKWKRTSLTRNVN